jgi:hypothetical protein
MAMREKREVCRTLKGDHNPQTEANNGAAPWTEGDAWTVIGAFIWAVVVSVAAY